MLLACKYIITPVVVLYLSLIHISADHRVFSYPKLSIREQMAAYKEIIDGSSLEGYRKIAAKEHEER